MSLNKDISAFKQNEVLFYTFVLILKQKFGGVQRLSLFKILKGDSSRIDTSITPFHDGYAYFTPDDGGFYIDSEDNGSQRRIRINPTDSDGSIAVTATLFASGWSSLGSQTLTINGLGADANGMIGLSQGASQEQIYAAMDANLYISGQSENSLSITAAGAIPIIDIPVVVVMMPTSSGSSSGNTTVDATLLASAWSSGVQTLTVSGLPADGNGNISLSQSVTETQFNAAIKAGLCVTGQSENTLVVTAKNTVPTVNIPVVVTILS